MIVVLILLPLLPIILSLIGRAILAAERRSAPEGQTEPRDERERDTEVVLLLQPRRPREPRDRHRNDRVNTRKKSHY